MRVTLRAASLVDGGFAEAAIVAYKPGTIAVRISPTALDITNAQTAQFTATVENDTTGGFVKWSSTGNCFSLTPLKTCGSMSQSTTSSGQAVTFVPGGSLMFQSGYDVTITATSSLDATATASAHVKVRCAVGCIP
jgi:hypothetical protein